MNEGRFSSAAEIETFYRQVLERFQTVPGVLQAGVSAPGLPLVSTGLLRQFSIVGQPEDVASLRPSAGVQMVTPGYFETFGIRVVQGRALTAHDGADSATRGHGQRALRRALSGGQRSPRPACEDGPACSGDPGLGLWRRRPRCSRSSGTSSACSATSAISSGSAIPRRRRSTCRSRSGRGRRRWWRFAPRQPRRAAHRVLRRRFRPSTRSCR